jgi:protein-tyrosine phosphatase
VIDLHTHVLPGIDDGPRTPDESLALLAASAERGVKTIVATPHVSQRYAGTRAAGVARAVGELNRAAAAAGLVIEVVAGAEIELLHAEVLPAEEVQALRLGSGGYALVECPFTATTAMAERLLWSAHRLWPLVLAHPERCRAFHGEDGLGLLERLVAQGAVVQVTAAALTGGFGRTVQRAALDMVEHGLVHIVASDTHDVEHRGPDLREHLDAAGLGDLVPLLCEQGPHDVLAGRPPDPAPPRPPTTARTPASWWRRLTARR